MKRKKNHIEGKKIRVMLVDDHAGMRQAVRTIIDSEPDLAVVGEADSGHNALDLFRRITPDIILMDGSMPQMNGIEATRQLRQLQPAAKIIGLTLYEESTYLEEMIVAGASGYVSKTGAPANVVKAIRAVASGSTYFDRNVDVPHRASPAPKDTRVVGQLSKDELAVMKRVADGQTNAEIATELDLALSVVERHRTEAMRKLNLRSRVELARVGALLNA
ncbi:MAG TPA: response regulator transcription factor [Candidatus Udaeobacter sp.]|jgi:two-component system response regulator NreC